MVLSLRLLISNKPRPRELRAQTLIQTQRLQVRFITDFLIRMQTEQLGVSDRNSRPFQLKLGPLVSKIALESLGIVSENRPKSNKILLETLKGGMQDKMEVNEELSQST
jgi:hypothetical protein